MIKGICSIFAVPAVCAVALSGCMDSTVGERTLPDQKSAENAQFDIPPSLVHRAERAYYAARDSLLAEEGVSDFEELMGLGENGFDNAPEIARRKRGVMKFVPDGLTPAQRAAQWPFGIEDFEATLEARLARDEDGLFRLKPDDPSAGEAPLGEDGLIAANPTFRWLNAQIAEWSERHLDATFRRLSKEDFYKLMGVESGDEDSSDPNIRAWKLNDEWYFLMGERNGAWELRDYLFLMCVEGAEPVVMASFNSFPSQKEACAAMGAIMSPAAMNNVAALEWCHRSQKLEMNPWKIKYFLETAVDGGCSTAKENLSVLLEHIPELETGE